ncbi:NEDD4-binding protein 2-like 1 isoform X5 [Choloepus didactylus]|uniref:NEDD4-binding protein 2-like 1 isoform X5 n=1 Tax=Choloepus didactylus TaxID=27675 RepID=UPI00189FA049|nr:NEDD4-binding protein 2-like 1 isoform X5 [Choloepus didactylus]
MEDGLLRSFGRLSLGPPPPPPPQAPPPPARGPPARRHGCRKRLYLLRGLPGSGKTTLARQLQHDFPRALVFSTDDFFFREDGTYEFNPDFLEEAHDWNQKRARRAMRGGASPIIIDNTNLHAWEMQPYAAMVQRWFSGSLLSNGREMPSADPTRAAVSEQSSASGPRPQFSERLCPARSPEWGQAGGPGAAGRCAPGAAAHSAWGSWFRPQAPWLPGIPTRENFLV